MECPVCQEEVTFEGGQVWETLELFCTRCLTTLNVKIILETAVSVSSDGNLSRADFDTPEEELESLIDQPPDEEEMLESDDSHSATKKVLLCLEGVATRDLVEALLKPEDIHLIHIPSEMEALVSADCLRPDIVVVDLDLSQNSEIDLCAEIRKNPLFKDSALIVIGSMFEKDTRYRDQKRTFTGADDFIDRYYLEKELLGKILNREESVLSGGCSEKNEFDGTQEPEQEIPELEVSGDAHPLEASNDGFDEDSPKNAEQVARDVVSAMIRCNEAKVEEGIRRGALYDFLSVEIEESRRKYETQVSETTRSVSNYFEKILEEKLRERKEDQVVPETGHDLRTFISKSLDNASVSREALESSDPHESLLDGFESTALDSEPETTMGQSFQTDLEETVVLELETLESSLPDLSQQEDLTEVKSESFNLEPTPDFEERFEGFETTSLLDDRIGGANEPTAVIPPGSDVLEEAVPLEATEVASSTPMSSGFDDAPEEETSAVKTAKRLARIIVSDIVIYNEKKVEEGLQSGQFFELLRDEIDEGRQLYQSRVAKDGLDRDYLQEALSDYVNKKTSVSFN